MANGHGGPRKPAKPAPVSAPGRLSKRTDGGPGQKMRALPDAGYGEQAAFESAQSGAAMELATPGPGGAPSGIPPGAMPPAMPVEVPPFGAASSRPGEPVTAGAAMGAGPGPEVLGLKSESDLYAEDKAKLAAYLPVLEYRANLPNAMPSLRAYVRKIKAVINGSVV